MWCGQSFRSLADLTTHMSETKHYTKVIPQEQLSTWRAQHSQSRSPSGSSTPSPCQSEPLKNAPNSVPNCKNRKTSVEKPRKKAIPVRKLLEMERLSGLEGHSSLVVNDENVSSDANRETPGSNAEGATSILGSLERLVESSFNSNSPEALQVMLAKRALEDHADQDHEEEDLKLASTKRPKCDEKFDSWPLSSSSSANAAELKFVKYSELAKELSSNR